MRTMHFRSLSIAALVFLALAGTTAAQSKSAALLNTLEVQQLVTRGASGDHARLSAHFTALADSTPPRPSSTRRCRRASPAIRPARSGQA